MRYLWSRLIIFFLMVEVILFGLYYNFGPRGRVAVQQLQELMEGTSHQITKMTMEHKELQNQIESWKSDPFLQEKFARERLALQKEGEIIYFR